jgi:predicted dinucleotide-binding enzyme
MATIGILGTGRMGVCLTLLFADIGHQVILGSRDRLSHQQDTLDTTEFSEASPEADVS